MKTVFITLFLVASSLLTKAQIVVYDQNAEIRTVAPFTAVQVSGSVMLYLAQGPVPGVAISAGEAKYNNKIMTSVSDGVLHITVDGGIWNGFNWTDKKLRAYVTATDLQNLEVSGASFVSIEGQLASNALSMNISGASEVKGMVNNDRLNINISGASIARLAGTVKEGTIDGSGASRVNSYDLIYDQLKASTSGASNLKISVRNELTAAASGGSIIYYKGPGVLKSANANSGSVIQNKDISDK